MTEASVHSIPAAQGVPCPEPVQSIAVVSGKGGVGKSVVASNLAVALARRDHQVLLFDGDLALGALDQLLGIDVSVNVSHLGSSVDTLDEILVSGPPGIQLIPASHGVVEMASLSQIEYADLVACLSRLDTAADTLIVDLASGLSDDVLSFAGATREVLLVVGEEPASQLDAAATVRVLHERSGIQRFRVVANLAESTQQGLDIYAALAGRVGRDCDALLDYCGSIPEDPAIRTAVKQRQSVLDARPRSAASLAFQKLASRVSRWPRPVAPSGRTEFFLERLVQAAMA